MSVYRTSAGHACPRCRKPLARDTEHGYSCADGCGVWMSAKLVDDSTGMDVVAKSRGNPFRATPLPPTKCLVCKKPLNDLYKGAHDVLTIGQCLGHGIWLERSTRADFEALFAPERRARALAAAREAELAKLDPEVAKLVLRIEQLERVVQTLQAEITALKSRV